MSDLERPQFNEREKLLEKQREELMRSLASRLHEEWRAKRKKEDGSFESRLKETKDALWTQSHAGQTEIDIANTAFADLPRDWQEENLLAAKVALEKLEDVLNLIHDRWLDRNDENASPEQKTQYSRLPKGEKAKDIAILEEAIEMMRNQAE